MKKFVWPFVAFFAANWGAEMVYKNQVHAHAAPMWGLWLGPIRCAGGLSYFWLRLKSD
jgi:hypothetical protein